MLNHSRPHIRKRAILGLYRVCEKHPQVIQSARPRLEEKLNDSDSGMPIFSQHRYDHSSSVILGVIAATVNVLCELARRDPQEYLTLAPRLFQLLTTSSNNWMLIKIVKIVRLIKQQSAPVILSWLVWLTFST